MCPAHSSPLQTRTSSRALRAGTPFALFGALRSPRDAPALRAAHRPDEESIMAKAAEHGQPPAVVRVIELVGVSSQSWSDAAQQAVTRASQTLRHITGLDVVNSSAAVRDGKIVEYHVNVKVAFLIEGAQIDKP